jgi:hypothetical protein
VRKSLISITGRGMVIRNYQISVSYHEKLMTLSMVSTPGMARVTRALSSAQLELPIAKPHLKEKDALA